MFLDIINIITYFRESNKQDMTIRRSAQGQDNPDVVTMKKEVVTKDQMIDGINRRLARNYKVICNNTLPQYVSESINNPDW